MRSGSLVLAVLALLAAAMLVAAGCTTPPSGNQTTNTTTPTPAGNATVLPTGNVTANVTGNVTPVNTSVTNTTAPNITAPFVNATWRWIGQSGSKTVQVSSPNQYTLAFFTNGTYAIKADCNTGKGNYTVNATKMKITPAYNMTTKYCGDQSLDKTFTAGLAQVTGYQMDTQGRLVLFMVNQNERLIFEKVPVTKA